MMMPKQPNNVQFCTLWAKKQAAQCNSINRLLLAEEAFSGQKHVQEKYHRYVYNLLLEHLKKYTSMRGCIFTLLKYWNEHLWPMPTSLLFILYLVLAWSSGRPKRRFFTFYGWFFGPFALETTTTLVKISPSNRSCWWSSNPLVGNSSWQSVINWHSQNNSNLNKFPSLSSQLCAWHRWNSNLLGPEVRVCDF